MTSRSSRPTFPCAQALGSAFVVGALALGACNSAPFQAPKPEPEGQADRFYAVNPIRDLDLLFMIDNSGSMKEEQTKLRKNFPTLIETLRQIPGGLPNVHIGVISSDVGAGNVFISGNPACNRPGGDKGEFQAKAGCGLNADANFIISLNNDTQKNFMGKLEDVFSCIADLGTSGCGFEHQLQSVRVALAENVTPKNAGFLRKDAFLAIVLITDEDDCSAPPTSDLFADQSFGDTQTGSLRCNIAGHLCNGEPVPGKAFMSPLTTCSPNPKGRLIPVDDIKNFVLSLKPNFPDRIIVSAITGIPAREEGTQYAFTVSKQPQGPDLLDVEPVCNSGADGTAAPSLRVSQFVKSFGDNGTIESICNSDYSPALKRLGDLIAARLDPGCISEKLIDTDTKTAGIQAECSVVDRVPDSNTGAFDDTVLPECGKGPAPCWKLQAPGENGNMCKAGNYRVIVDRGGKEAAKGTIQSVKCRSCALADDPRCP
ncbi:MAG: hypothetical protein SF187_10455 [Deltaproteobacteria bacterium]|nr:hypothetical protein [Deltaproteobacteria bacterium]